MTGTTRRTAVAAVAASLGLTGIVLLAAAPTFSANAASRTVAVPDPGGGDGGGVIDGNQPTVDVTTTVTVTAAPTETADPVVTITTTVTPAPTVTLTRTVRPTRSTRAEDPPPSTPPTTQQQPVIPTHQPVQTADSQPQPSQSTSEPPITLPSATPSTSETGSSTPVESSTAFEEPTPDSVAIEIRNASPEYDQIGMSRQLAVPGILLVLLVVFAVFVLQSRLQRVAHAAAVRRAGPRGPGGRRDGPETGPYPGPAYAPIIGFVPMQPVVMPPAQPMGVYPPGYPVPNPYGMAQQPGMFQQTPPVQPVPGHAQPQAGSPMPPQPDPAGGQAGQPFPPGGPQAAPPGPAGAEPPGAGPQAEPSGGWFTPRTEPPRTPGQASPFRPGGDGPWPRGGDRDADEATLLLPYEPPPRPALEPGPSAFGRPVETTVSVERIGPDGRPMSQPPARGTDSAEQDPDAETGSASDD